MIGAARAGRNADTIRTTARAAVRARRPVEVLAVQLYALDLLRPKGFSPNTGRVAAVLAATSDFRSGRNARPGRQICAELLGISERTVERHWRVLEGADCGVTQTAYGRWLTATDRAEAAAEPDAPAARRHRWRDRAEWRLAVPAWAHELTADELAPYLARAAALLAEVAAAGAVDNSRALCMAGLPFPVRVAPSRKGEALEGVFYLRGASSTSRQEPKGGAPRPSPTKTGPKSRGADRPAPSRAAILAAMLAADRRFGWLRRANHWQVARTLERVLGRDTDWTPDDVDLAGHQRIRHATYTTPAVIDRPAGYLAWMLAGVDPACPPAAGIRAAEAAEAAGRAERQAAGRAAHAERRTAAAAARGGAGHAAARAAVAATRRRG